jgi:hypothetical protein
VSNTTYRNIGDVALHVAEVGGDVTVKEMDVRYGAVSTLWIYGKNVYVF